MAHALNLDALIPREDFEVQAATPATPSGRYASEFKLSELEDTSVTYLALRKPDSQRETADWQPDMVADLIASFLDGDLIPSVILWRSETSGNLFVIDGAHRLSALIAWVHNDYGSGKQSVEFFDNLIPPEQKAAAEKCRVLVDKTIGSYHEIKAALIKPENASPERVKRARNMAAFGIQLQWVNGDAQKAEASFFKINQKATPIDKTELLMLQSRRKPTAIASRALIHAGVGHKYWARFPEEKQREIETIARSVYDTLFVPALEVPIKTLDLPVAGRGYSADSVKLIFEFVSLANGIRVRDTKKKPQTIDDDVDGSKTIKYLNNVKRLAQLISGSHASSLGLHPAVYFYGATGRYQPAAFMAVVSFLDDLEKRDQIANFTIARARIEELLVKNPQFLNQIVREYGASSTTITALIDLYSGFLEGVSANLGDDKIITSLRTKPRLQVLSEISAQERTLGKNFSTETKSRAFLREAIDKTVECAICGARIHRNSISMDHIQAKRDGGTGAPENAQVAHPYCNSARDRIEALRASLGASSVVAA